MGKNIESQSNGSWLIRSLVEEDFGLAIEQREFVWKTRDVIKLLDSIFRGYPIGTIVLGSPVKYKDDKGNVHTSIKGSPRAIFDGQQRIKAMKMAFIMKSFTLINKEKGVDNSKKHSVYVDLKNFGLSLPIKKESEKGSKNPDETRKEAKKYRIILKYDNDAISGYCPFEIFPADIGEGRKFKQEDAREIMKARDRKCYKSMDDSYWVSLHKIIKKPANIPEEYSSDAGLILDKFKKAKVGLHIASTMPIDDLHNLFIRVNRAGVPLSQTEAFFAGVKQHWDTAEVDLKDYIGEGHVFRLNGIVSLLARIANAEIAEKRRDGGEKVGDAPWLRVELKELNSKLWMRMQLIVKESEYFKQAINYVEENVKRDLMYGVTFINEAVLGNIVVYYYRALIKSKIKFEKKWPSAIPCLLFFVAESGITGSLRSRQFLVTMFKHAWRTGGEIKPGVDEWNKFTKKRFKEFRVDKQIKECMPRIENHKWKIDRIKRAELYLSIYHKIPFGHTSFDLDHIIAYNYFSSRYRGVLCRKKISEYILNLGNMWYLNSSFNRSERDGCPVQKVDKVYSSGCQLIVGNRANEIKNEIPEMRVFLEKTRQLMNKKKNLSKDVGFCSYMKNRETMILEYVLSQHLHLGEIL